MSAMPVDRLVQHVATILLVVLAPALAAAEAAGPVERLDAAAAAILAEQLEAGYQVDNHLVVPDLGELDDLPESTRAVVGQAGSLFADIGATGYFELSQSRSSPPLDNVMLRAIVFADEDRCRAFCQTKYERDGAGFAKRAEEGLVLYTGTRHGKVVVVDGPLHLSVFRLAGGEHNEAIARAAMAAMSGEAERRAGEASGPAPAIGGD